MLVSKISPAPSSYARLAHCTASIPISILPPCLYMVQPFPSALRFASMAQTTHWLPNLPAASLMTCGLSMAAEFTATLSAPALRMVLKSSTVRMPPPTVNGMNTFSATLRTMSTTVFRLSDDAVISKNTSSSAPFLL